MNLLEVKNLCCGYEKQNVLEDVSFCVDEGEFIAVIGPNGAGKTTLFRALSGILKPREGELRFHGKLLQEIPRIDLAKEVAVLPQTLEIPFSFTVEEFIEMGRFPHGAMLKGPSSKDNRIVEEAMKLTDVGHLRGKIVNRLSGGERQRVFLAQALAQEPKLMLLDEPTTHLDIKYQTEILELLNMLNEGGMTVITVLHDLNIAAEYCKRIILLNRGRICSDGTAAEVIDYRIIEEVYNTKVVVRGNPISGKPYVVTVSKKYLKNKY